MTTTPESPAATPEELARKIAHRAVRCLVENAENEAHSYACNEVTKGLTGTLAEKDKEIERHRNAIIELDLDYQREFKRAESAEAKLAETEGRLADAISLIPDEVEFEGAKQGLARHAKLLQLVGALEVSNIELERLCVANNNCRIPTLGDLPDIIVQNEAALSGDDIEKYRELWRKIEIVNQAWCDNLVLPPDQTEQVLMAVVGLVDAFAAL